MPACGDSDPVRARLFLPADRGVDMPIDDDIIETEDGPITWAEWKRNNPVQIPSRRRKGKKLPGKVKRFTSDA